MSDIRILTTHFNFAQFKRPREIFKLFRSKIRNSIDVAEVSSNGRFYAANEEGDLRLTGDVRNCMFLKPRLLNLLIRRLPPEIKKIVWVDGDVLFEDPYWLSKTSAALEEVDFLQPFSEVYSLSQEGYLKDPPRPSFCKEYRTNPDFRIEDTSRGMVWAGRIDSLNPLPLEPEYKGIFDSDPLGEEDQWMASIWAGRGPYGGMGNSSPAMQRHQELWMGDSPERKLGFLNGRIFHLYHGSKQNRNYGEPKYRYIREKGFDPETFLRIREDGLFEWTDEHLDCGEHMLNWFRSRKEDLS